MCQEFVATGIELISCKYPEVYVLHYMDNILISHPSESTISLTLADLTKDLEAWRLCIAPEWYKKCLPFNI
jgi:hypothetical protein